MQAIQLDMDMDTAVAAGLAAANSSAGATLTLDGSLTSGGIFTAVDGLGHQLEITDTATLDQSGATFTVTGTDADGHAQTEDITGPGSGATVYSAKYFATVTSVTITSPVATATVNMGTTAGGVVSSKTIVLNHYVDTATSIQVDVTGTINFDIEDTLQNPLHSYDAPFDVVDQNSLAWLNDANFTGKTADLIAQLGVPGVRAIRVTTNSYSAGAEMQIYIVQPNSTLT